MDSRVSRGGGECIFEVSVCSIGSREESKSWLLESVWWCREAGAVEVITGAWWGCCWAGKAEELALLIEPGSDVTNAGQDVDF